MEFAGAQGHRLLLRSQGSSRYINFGLDTRRFSQAVSTATATLTPTPAGGPQPPANLADYVLLAEKSLVMGQSVSVESGNVGVNDGPDGPASVELIIGQDVSLSDATTLSADSILLSSPAEIPRVVFYNDIHALPPAQITGQRVTPLNPPLCRFPPFPPSPSHRMPLIRLSPPARECSRGKA